MATSEASRTRLLAIGGLPLNDSLNRFLVSNRLPLDIIFYKMYNLKTIQGKASVGNRLKESVGQANHVLLNIRCSYDTRTLAVDI